MMNIPVFSVIIPVYNTEAYLPRCVSSVLEQTFGDLEIILVDDGSPDGCPVLCDAYADQDPRVKVIHKKNGGLSDARNAGIRAAAGEYILLLDSDDYLERDACQRLLPAARTHSDILIGKWIQNAEETANASGEPFLKVWNSRAYLKAKTRAAHFQMAAVLYIHNREFLLRNELEFKFGIRHEDDEFTPRAFLAASSAVETNVEFYRYIIRENSITTQKDLRKNDEDLFQTCIALERQYSALDDEQLARQMRDILSMQLLSLFQAGRLYQYGKPYIHRAFVWRNAFRAKTKLKAALYCFAPALYWHINDLSKKFLRSGGTR